MLQTADVLIDETTKKQVATDLAKDLEGRGDISGAALQTQVCCMTVLANVLLISPDA